MHAQVHDTSCDSHGPVANDLIRAKGFYRQRWGAVAFYIGLTNRTTSSTASPVWSRACRLHIRTWPLLLILHAFFCLVEIQIVYCAQSDRVLATMTQMSEAEVRAVNLIEVRLSLSR